MVAQFSIRYLRSADSLTERAAGEVRIAPGLRVERVMGIEPTSEAWEAPVLPLNYTRGEPPGNSTVQRERGASIVATAAQVKAPAGIFKFR